MQKCKELYLHTQLTAFSRLAHMLLLGKWEEKRWSDQNLAEDQLCEGGWMWLPTHCSSAGDRAHRKLWEEVLFCWTIWSVLSSRDLWDYVLKTSKKTKLKTGREACIASSLDTPEGSRYQGSMGCQAATWREGQVWGELLCTTPHLRRLSAGINSSTGPALTLTLKRQYELFQDKVWA